MDTVMISDGSTRINRRARWVRAVILALSVVVVGLVSTNAVLARGGQSADDCPAGTTDPDCANK